MGAQEVPSPQHAKRFQTREQGPRKAIVRRWTRPSPIGLWAARRPAFSSSQGRCAGLLCALRQSKKTEISSGCSRSPPAFSSFISDLSRNDHGYISLHFPIATNGVSDASSEGVELQ